MQPKGNVALSFHKASLVRKSSIVGNSVKGPEECCKNCLDVVFEGLDPIRKSQNSLYEQTNQIRHD